MKRLLFLALLCVAPFAACGGCDDAAGGANNGGDGLQDGEACAADAQCAGTCGPDGVCVGGNNAGGLPDGEGCTASSDCAGTCAGGTCTGSGGGTGGDGSNNATNNGDLGSQQAYCDGEGPPIIQGSSGDTVCTGEVAAVAFRYAICTCGDFAGTNELYTDSFDSRVGPYDPNAARRSGSVGVNGGYTHTSKADILGSLWIAGGGTTSLTDEYEVAGELKVRGDLVSTSILEVGLDAYVTGDATLSTYTVAGTHHQPAGNAFNAQDSTLGATDDGPVTIDAPCDCDPDQLVDVDGFIDRYRTQNDNTSIDLDPTSLTNVTSPVTLNLSCGRFFLDEITGTAEIIITAEDRTALFIGGDISTTGKLTIQLAEGAELDLFVAGAFISTDEVDFGSIENPASVRMYLGGNDSITWTNKFSIGGNIYAPEVDLTLTDDTIIYGSLFVRNLTATNKLNVHYDSSILDAGETCQSTGGGGGGDANNGTGGGGGGDTSGGGGGTNSGTTGGGGGSGGDVCTDCRDCQNQSCNAGECGGCTSNADCCAPLLCLQGRCGVIE